MMIPVSCFSSVLEDRKVDVQIKDTPLPQVIELLFKGTDVSWTVQPDINNVKVTAVLKNVSLDTALREVAKASGTTYSVVTNDNKLNVTFQKSSPPANLQGTQSVSDQVKTTTRAILPNYANAGDLLDIIRQSKGIVRVMTNNAGALVMEGTEEGIEEAETLITCWMFRRGILG
jgi:type II secretory pathway component GspD/PulD (secretin)